MNLANRSVSYLKARRAYCLATLNDPATAEHRKPRIIAALDQLDACLRDRCQHCGRPLSLPESVAHHVSYHMGEDGGCGWRRVWREGYGSEPKKCGCKRFIPKGNPTTALIELGERSL